MSYLRPTIERPASSSTESSDDDGGFPIDDKVAMVALRALNRYVSQSTLIKPKAAKEVIQSEAAIGVYWLLLRSFFLFSSHLRLRYL